MKYLRVNGDEIQEMRCQKFEDGMRLWEIPMGYHGDTFHQ